MIIKQLKLYSVMCYFIIACMLSPNFKVALIFCFFMVFSHNLCKSSSVVRLSREAIGQERVS